MRHRNLHEAPGKKLARALDAAQGVGVASHTRPTGLQYLGDGDIIWRDPVTADVHSVKDLPLKIEEGLAAGFATASLRNTVSTSAPATTDGYPDGAYWVRIVSAEDQTVVGVWELTDGAWIEQPYDGGLVAPTIDAGLINVAVLGAQLIVARLLRTETNPVTGRYSVFDSEGLRVVSVDGPEDSEEVVINLGPDGEQLLQLGTGDDMVTIDSGDGVAAKTVTANQIYLDGRPIAQALDTGIGSVLAWKQLFGAYSRELVGRQYVLWFWVYVPGGRVYRLRTTSAIVRTESGSVNPMIQLHYTTNGIEPGVDWGGTCVGESTVDPYAGFRSLPPIERHLDFRDRSGMVAVQAAASLGDLNNTGWCRIDAPVHPFQMYLEDVGVNLPELGIAYTLAGGSGGEASPTRYTKTYTATGWATYFRNGARDTAAVGPIQGRAGGSANHRSCFFTFPSMTADLSGATIHRITLRSRAEHWWYGSGGTGAWCWHGDAGIPASSPALNFMRDDTGWPRGAVREAEIIPEEFAAWQSGARRGFGFDTASTSEVYYGRFSSNLAEHTITVEYSK